MSGLLMRGLLKPHIVLRNKEWIVYELGSNHFVGKTITEAWNKYKMRGYYCGVTL